MLDYFNVSDYEYDYTRDKWFIATCLMILACLVAHLSWRVSCLEEEVLRLKSKVQLKK